MALTDNIVSYWKFDESSGNAADSLGTNTLTNTGTYAYTAGLIGNCADLGSANTTKRAEKLTNLGWTGGAFTTAGWVNITTAPTAGNVVIMQTRRNSTSGRIYDMRYNNNAGSLEVQGVCSGATQTKVISTTTLTTGTWFFLTFTYDGSSTFELFINAATKGTNTDPILTVTGDSYTIGSNESGGLETSGKFDEWGVWSRVLTGSEITQLYNGGVGLTYPFTTTSATPFPPQLLTLNVG